ncbi:MAG TPA: hypothetical protein VL401_00630 [Alphaproteobacteria bacterium]|jgi:hypothetical protein|nr:hypothetical protein [Alphaproteobacteria bacterium]
MKEKPEAWDIINRRAQQQAARDFELYLITGEIPDFDLPIPIFKSDKTLVEYQSGSILVNGKLNIDLVDYQGALLANFLNNPGVVQNYVTLAKIHKQKNLDSVAETARDHLFKAISGINHLSDILKNIDTSLAEVFQEVDGEGYVYKPHPSVKLI